MLVLVGGLFIQRYTGNLTTYHQLEPACQKVRSIDDCRQNAIFSRNERLVNENRPVTQNPLSYSWTWVQLMEKRTYAVYGHQRFEPDRYVAVWLAAFIGIGLIGLVRYRNKLNQPLVLYLIIAGFSLVVLLIDNYLNYKKYGVAQLAVHGRYALGFLPLIYILAACFTAHLLRKAAWLAAYCVITILVLLAAGLPTYLSKTDSQWRGSSQPPKISLELRSLAFGAEAEQRTAK